MAFFAKSATAASARQLGALADLARERSPCSDWERAQPSKPDGVGCWRNQKDETIWTDWVPRERDESALHVQVMTDGTHHVAVRCFPMRWHPKLRSIPMAQRLAFRMTGR